MASVEGFIEEKTGVQQQLLQVLHDFLLSYPEVEAKIRFKIPFYYRHSWVCYINPVGSEQVELAFIHGKELSNEQGLLVDRGRKMVSGVLFAQPSEIPWSTLEEVLMEAFFLDEEKKK
jgi:hypothetical protein